MANYIPDDVLDQIRVRADIVDLIQSYVPTLKKNGANWKACCPFHQEKTPSFIVNPQRQSYKCFGCGKGGNVFSFVMEFEKLDFPNAAEFLARKYGVIIPEPEPYMRSGRSGNARSNGNTESNYNLRERLYTLHEKLADFYMKNLRENSNSAVSVYFKSRLIPQEFVQQFRIGASPDSWDAAIQFAHAEHFTDEELRLSGIVSEKEPGAAHIYDRFRNRLMFPIWNEQGRIVAFSARSVEKDPKGWKYVNSPESPIFKKSKTLYALHFARFAIAEKDRVVLCEGQLDTIALHRAGCSNAVAPQGTAFGQDQALILRRYSMNVTLALDNDKAGQEAVLKDAAILLPLGFSVKVAIYTGAKDADELLKTRGPEAVRKAVEDDAVDFFDFVYRGAAEKYDIQTPEGQTKAVAEVLKQIALIDSEAMREAYLNWLTGLTRIHINALRHDLNKILQAAEKQNRFAHRETVPEAAGGIPVQVSSPEILPRSVRMTGLGKSFAELLELLLQEKRFAEMASQDIETAMLDESPLGIAIETVIESGFNDEWEDAASLIQLRLQQKNMPLEQIAGLLTSIKEPGEKNAENSLEKMEKIQNFRLTSYKGCVKNIRKCYFTDERQRLIREALPLPDGEEKKALMAKVTDYSRQLLDLSRKHN